MNGKIIQSMNNNTFTTTMQPLKKIKSLFKREKKEEPKLHVTEMYLMGTEDMARLANGVYDEVRKDMKANGAKMDEKTEKFVHAVFLRGYHACYKHILEMITGQLSLEEMLSREK